MPRLNGKSALITGGTSGIGLATALRFLEEGARVAVTGRSEEGIAKARRVLGADILIIRSDAGAAAAQRFLATELGRAFGTLDIVFANAGITDFRPLEAWDESGFDGSIGTDLKGPFFLVQALLPILRNPASIILSGSVNAHLGMPTTHLYSAAKAGMVSLARTLSGELIGRGIRVNAISPGPVDTPLNDKLGLGRWRAQPELSKCSRWCRQDASLELPRSLTLRSTSRPTNPASLWERNWSSMEGSASSEMRNRFDWQDTFPGHRQ